MGKSEIEELRPSHLNLRLAEETNMKSSWTIGGQNDDKQKKKKSTAERPLLLLPMNMEVFNNQVAGHMNDGTHLGMLKTPGKILKPLMKPACGEREISFYEEISKTEDPMLLEMKKFVPKYHGTETVNLGDRKVECIVLEDLTKDVKEPCIMDIKIGRRTYDPFASYEKIINEDQKYHDTKRDLGFCIPGFQVCKISNGRICKYGKDYGKKLNKETVEEALRIFLNADAGLSRSLLLQLLASLWSIQNWTRKQRKLRLYSSSLLLVYDARKLRQSQQSKTQNSETLSPKPPRTLKRSQSLYRPMSILTLNTASERGSKTGFSGQLTKDGPILPNHSSPGRVKDFTPPPTIPERKTPSLKRMHSFQNNYDKDLQNLKMDYMYILDELVSERKNQVWASVKMIDFAHVFPAEHREPDRNFLEGIENLIRIIETFLAETDWDYENHNS